MASGYLHSATIGALLTAGADPEQEDAQGRRWVACFRWTWRRARSGSILELHFSFCSCPHHYKAHIQHSFVCSPLGLVEGLREALPTNNPALIGRRMALEDVVKVLTGGGVGQRWLLCGA